MVPGKRTGSWARNVCTRMINGVCGFAGVMGEGWRGQAYDAVAQSLAVDSRDVYVVDQDAAGFWDDCERS